MANDIKTGETFGNFRVTSVTTLHEQGETAVMLSHGPTGLQWLHFLADDPVSSCAIGIVTPVTDDCGLPHVLEHMIFTGSKKHPGTDLARGMMNRTVTESMNGCTYPFMTSYFFNSAVESDMRAIFEVWFDAILRPELSDAAFYREAGRFIPQDASNPGGPLAYTGVVFNEMCRDKGKLSEKIICEAKRHLVPDNGFGFTAGGRPAGIMSLTPDDVRDYHTRWYHPANMRIVTRGRALPRGLFSIADKLLDGVEAGEAAPPFSPQTRWTEPRSAEIAITALERPHRSHLDKMPNQGLLWLLPDTSNPRAELAIKLFSKAIDLEEVMNAKTKRSHFGESIDAKDLSVIAECAPEAQFETMEDQIGPDKYLGIYGYFAPKKPEATLWTRTECRLRKILDDPETAEKIGAAASKYAEYAAQTINEDGLADSARRDAFKMVFHNWVFRDDPFFDLVSSQHLALCHQFERNPDSAVEIVRSLLLDNPHRLDLSIREVEAGEDPDSTAIAQALADKRTALSDESCAALAAHDRGVVMSQATAPSSGEPLPETTLEDIPDDLFAIHCDATKETLCGATFLQIKTTPSDRAWLAGFADLSDFTSEQLLLIPFIVDAFRDRLKNPEGLHFPNCCIDIGPYAETGILDGVQRRGIKFMVPIESNGAKSAPRLFSTLFQLRDPLSYKKARKMMGNGTDFVKVRQTKLRDKVWATCETADASLLKACSDGSAFEAFLEYRTGCARPGTPQAFSELAAGFVREASETADLLHNPARWTFALIGPKHLTEPVREALLATLLSAPARPIGPAAELKFAPKAPGEKEREAKTIPGRKVATVTVSIPAPAEAALFRRRLEIGARLLERDFAEPRIRKGIGAYGARFSWRANTFQLESHQNPDVGDTLSLVRAIRDFVAEAEWTADDVRQAALAIASRFIYRGQSPHSLVSQCLEDYIGRVKPSSVRGELERIANMNPEDIRETLLEALDAGMGHETVSVEASEEAIAEANSVLPEELRLHVAEAS